MGALVLCVYERKSQMLLCFCSRPQLLLVTRQWFCRDTREDIVLALRARQVIVGFEDGTMRWEEGLTRAQAAKIMATAMGLYEQIEKSLSLQDMFPDVPRAHWAFATVNLAGELAGERVS